MPRGPARWEKHINSHERFVHDSIDSLGYDWSRVADPSAPPHYPGKVYLPRTTEDVVRVLREVRQLGEHVVVRAHGHSSNDLVVAEGGTVLLTEKMNRVLDVDEAGLTATVQPGCQSADVDDLLAERGLGLPVIGDHNHVTAGGFASVGGISASSFRHGLFVDIIQRLEYVTWEGEVVRCSRDERPEDFHRVLLGLGRYGVITAITLRIERVEKYGRLWRNRQTHYRSLDAFLDDAVRNIRTPPPEAVFMRGMFVDAGMIGVGQFSVYVDTEPAPLARLEDRVCNTALHGVGWAAGKLPSAVDRALKYVGLAGILYPPRFTSQKNAESFSDKIIDSTVGEPTRYLVAIARQRNLDEVCRRLLALLVRYRAEHRCFSVLTLYLKGIVSPYLAAGNDGDDRWAEVLFYVAIKPENLPPELLDRLVEEFDDTCLQLGAYRYMHSRTTRDPDRRRRLDPNSAYEREASPG
ncbi:MAG TPA: FAD-binding oxidoreductase [Solirubrobacterales bacterium]|nr:FAD-binding oxidoreductase [Solirubrobacterales bacterium]